MSITISTDPYRFELNVIHGFLKTAYWCEGLPREVIERAIRHSLCFAMYEYGHQIGFARAITDRATYAYIADVFVLESHRGRGLGKRLIQTIMSHPELQGVRRWSLVTRDAHGLYKQFGFQPLSEPEHHMEMVKPDVYKD